MPKRAPSPEVVNDIEVLAIYSPYPPSANLETGNEQADFVSWVAACLGSIDYLIAIGWKPKTPNVVLVEVSRRFQHWEKILGEHIWKDILAVVPPAYMQGSSKVFFSTLQTHRNCEKKGWKFRYLDDAFINTEFKPDLCRSPYPKSDWCPVPPLDQTNQNVCARLPKKYFPNSAPQPKPVLIPGSVNWTQRVEAKGGNGDAKAQSQHTKPSLPKGVPLKLSARATVATLASSGASLPPSVYSEDYFDETSSIASAWDGDSTVIGSESQDVDSSHIDSMSQATLFDQNRSPEDTAQTTVVVPAQPEEVEENLWQDDITKGRKIYDDLEICPTHKVRCKTMCSDFAEHMKKHKLNPRHFQLEKGPSNVYKLQREVEGGQQKQGGEGSWESANRRGRGRGRGRGRHGPSVSKW